MPKPSLVIVSAITLAYPFAIYLGLGRVDPAWLGLGLVALALARAWASRDPVWLFALAGAVLLALASVLGKSWLPVKLYPAMVNAALLLVFGASVLRPPTVIERIARLAEGALSPPVVAYTRRVTVAWCIFFACNGIAAFATAVWASDEAWLLYNGLLAYLLMALLFAGEWLVRRRVRARLAPAAGAGNTHV
ncbi:MAG: hypothetical protein HYX47_06015 [Burkholderiales bacterium]|nr:hypothetical protein [Burkholderiales bacterium]